MLSVEKTRILANMVERKEKDEDEDGGENESGGTQLERTATARLLRAD